MEQLRCVVERVTYQNEQNGYTVIKCRAKGYSGLVTVVGAMPEVHVGSVLRLEGMWKVDSKYGRQFSAEKWEETLPATVYGIEKYLGSGLIKGIGPKFAGRIVRTFGENTLEVIETEPERLLEVPGIGRKRVERIRKSWQDQKEIKNIMLFLQGHEVSTAHATKIYKAYGNDSIPVVRENPYRLADDIWGIGFKTADQIASKLGMAHDCYERLRGGLMYTLNKLAGSGHCYAVREQLLKTGAKLLETEEPLLDAALTRMIEAGDVISEEEALYLPPFYFSEAGCARKIHALINAPKGVPVEDGRLEALFRRSEIHYDKVQMDAIRMAVSSRPCLVQGREIFSPDKAI